VEGLPNRQSRIAVSSAITCCEKGQWQHGVSLLNMAAVDRVAPNIISCRICTKDGMVRIDDIDDP
jgi:hypothetical protein